MRSPEQTKFPEQEAPEKNTDKAYIQVGHNGQPVMPNDSDEGTLPMEQDKELLQPDPQNP